MMAFGIGTALAGSAGALIGPVFNVTPIMGVIPVVKAYIIVVLGGLGSIPGAIVGALILGQIESFATILIPDTRSEEHTSELQSLMRISYAVFCLKKKKQQ